LPSRFLLLLSSSVYLYLTQLSGGDCIMAEKKISIMIRPWLSDSIDFPRSRKRFVEYSLVLMDVQSVFRLAFYHLLWQNGQLNGWAMENVV